MIQALNRFKLVLILAGLFFCRHGYALEFPEKPNDSDYFVDKAGLIDAETAMRINALASKLLQEEQVAMYVATLTSLADFDAAGYSIEGYAADLFDEWGI